MQTIDHETGEVIQSGDQIALSQTPDPIKLHKTGMIVDGSMTYDQWHDFGQTLQQVEGAIQWWIGDWYNYGEATFGEVANQAVDEYGLSYESLKRYSWVSRKVEPVRRRTNLSFSHHENVAKFEPEEQVFWLERAEADNLSVSEHRREIKAAKAIAALPEVGSTNGAFMRIYSGDSFNILPTLEPKSFDLLLTDPPYNTQRMSWDTWESDLEFVGWLRRMMTVALPLMRDQYNAFLFCSPNNAADVEIMLRTLDLKVKSRIIWNHRNMSMGRDVSDRFINTYDVCLHFGTAPLNWPLDWDDRRFDVQLFAAPQTNFEDTKLHQTQKPLELIKLLCSVGSSIGDNVLDPFSGAGTTGAACLELGRNCTMIDLEFAELSAKRVGAEVIYG